MSQSATSQPQSTPRRRKAKSPIKALIIAALCSLIALAVILFHDPSLLTWSKAWPGLVRPLLRMLGFLGIGLVVGIAVEGMGWAPLLATFVRPVMRFGNLTDESGAAFTTAFFSGTAANTMLMTFWKEKKISLQEMKLSYLINTGLPVFLLHLPTTFFIIVPMTRTAGIIYLSLNGLAALIRTLGLLVWTRVRLVPRTNCAEMPTQQAHRTTSAAKVFSAFRKKFTRICTITAPVYFLIYALNQAGMFEYLRTTAAGWVTSAYLPVEAVSVVVFAVAAEFTTGIAAAGALLDGGALTTPQLVLALVLGTIVATPIRALRHQLPSQTGVFSFKIGFPMLLMSQALRISSLIGVTILYLWIAG
ncbi:nucleoside recognition domain-containing protein [Halodesulfovibrio spirochaetisodalis]|uniref:Nucleoside recognition domain-containing protein n=1 Tax=Halodesulfovibrio spirochaetisodalis TaxID=1560234 RepID=A0A1B7XAV3_9BACT|nr:nucleoside recognition domain-containing protein [Halodesulfovibrio spirochaetisodalis]OBQ46499.1 nucleoside recognition domain-containing protein [Halodesulfovibrio spirochaetisodalis]